MISGAQLNSILKKLISDGEIKEIKQGQQQRRKKVFLVASIEPHRDVIGAHWEHDQCNFDIMNDLM